MGERVFPKICKCGHPEKAHKQIDWICLCRYQDKYCKRNCKLFRYEPAYDFGPELKTALKHCLRELEFFEGAELPGRKSKTQITRACTLGRRVLSKIKKESLK